MKTYHGSCHCGAVKFEVDTELSQVERCNCSICSKKGALFVRVPPAQFRLLQGEDELMPYQFNTKLARHLFCKRCGIHSFSNPRSAPELILINVRCLDDFDVETEHYEVNVFDGRNWEASFKARQEAAKRAD